MFVIMLNVLLRTHKQNNIKDVDLINKTMKCVLNKYD